MKARIKIIILYLLSFVVSVAPCLIYFFANLDRYTKTVPQTIKLCFGGGLVAFLIILKIAGKLKINKRSTFFIVLLALSYLLESILSDLLIFSFLAIVGELLDLIIILPINKIKERQKNEKTADVTAKKVEEMFQKYYRGENI
jgi:hypothetical protein